VLGVDPDADEVEVGAFVDSDDRERPDPAGRPDDDAPRAFGRSVTHGFPFLVVAGARVPPCSGWFSVPGNNCSLGPAVTSPRSFVTRCGAKTPRYSTCPTTTTAATDRSPDRKRDVVLASAHASMRLRPSGPVRPRRCANTAT